MLERGVQLEERDFTTQPLAPAELDALIGNRDHREFLNPRNELYRERGMKEQPPSRADAIKLMAQHPNLIRRPIIIRGSKMVLGWDEEQIERLM